MRSYRFACLAIVASMVGACSRSDGAAGEADSLTAIGADSGARIPVASSPSGDSAAPAKSPARDPDVAGVEHWRDLTPDRPAARDQDHTFLRNMADHNEGMLELATFAVDRADSAAVQEVRRLRDAHARIRNELIQMIRSRYTEVLAPVPVPAHNPRLDSIDLAKPGEFTRDFFQHTTDHHREWIRRIDQLSPQLKDADVKAYGTQLRAQLQRDLDSFTRRLTG
jgi:uncharacterized protein (DUF305 family)